MKVNVWYCYGNQCITPCILPFDEDHDTPDGCLWGGFSSFVKKEFDVNELLKNFIPDCKFLNFQQMCSLRKGICPSRCDGIEKGCKEIERILQ